MKSDSVLNQPLNNDQFQAHKNYVDIHALNDLKLQAREDQRAALKPVAEQFEALFLEQIFKESRKVKLDGGWLDGQQADFYKDWYDKQLAQDISAKGSLGFADNIVEQLLPSIPNIENMAKKDNKIDEMAVQSKGEENKSFATPTQEVLSLRALTQKDAGVIS